MGRCWQAMRRRPLSGRRRPSAGPAACSRRAGMGSAPWREQQHLAAISCQAAHAPLLDTLRSQALLVPAHVPGPASSARSRWSSPNVVHPQQAAQERVGGAHDEGERRARGGVALEHGLDAALLNQARQDLLWRWVGVGGHGQGREWRPAVEACSKAGMRWAAGLGCSQAAGRCGAPEAGRRYVWAGAAATHEQRPHAPGSAGWRRWPCRSRRPQT